MHTTTLPGKFLLTLRTNCLILPRYAGSWHKTSGHKTFGPALLYLFPLVLWELCYHSTILAPSEVNYIMVN